MATPNDQRPDGLATILRRRNADEIVDVQRLQAALGRGLFGREPDPVRLGRYTVVRRIGAGGFGVVYEGWDPQLERRVALKLLRACDSRDEIMREARAMALVHHPCVVAIHDVVDLDDGDGLFIVMELVEGPHLGRWAGVDPPPSWQRIVAVLSAAARGLEAAHARGLIHRDFKPENVLVDAEDRVRVSDFGVAVHASRADGRSGGTWSYMAPEQLAGEAADARSDLYAFCVVAFELLHGRRPFAAATRDVLVRLQRAGPPTLPRGRVPAAIDATLARGLALAPADRWPDMAALVRALESAARGPVRRRQRIVAGVAAVGLVATMVALGRTPPDPCPVEPSLTAAAWGAERRALLADLVEPTAGGRWVVAQLDQHAAAWQEAHALACRSTHVDAARSEAEQQLVQQCLDDRLAVLDAVVGVLHDAEGAPSSHAAVSLLEPPGICLQAQGSTLPSTDVTLVRDAARAEALRTTGDLQGALALADATYRGAFAADDAGSQARALLTKGRAERELDRAEAAARDFTEAARLATLRGDTAIAMRAKTWLALVLDHDLGRTDEADRMLVWLEAEVERRGDVDLADGELGFVTGEIRRRQARHAEAEAAHAHALELYEAQLGREHPRLTGVLHGIGVARCETGATPGGEAWIARALAIVEASYGPDHPSAAVQHNALGACALRSDDFVEAARRFELAHAIFAKVLGESNGRTIGVRANLAAAWSSAGEHERAVEAFADVLQALEARHGAEHREVVRAAMNLGHALLNAGQAAAALPHLERAARSSAARSEAPTPDDARASSLYARALLELGGGSDGR